MKIKFAAAVSLAVIVLSASPAFADKTPMSGTIISMQSVDCGTKKQSKKSSTALLCQQYVIHTTNTEYQIRQQKPANQEILHADTSIQFTLDRDKMKFKVNGKKYEYLVVGTSVLTSK